MRDYAHAYYNRGYSFFNHSRYEEAITDYDRVIEITPDDGSAYQNRSFAYKKLGQLDKAKADCDKAKSLKVHPLTCDDS